MHYHITFSIHFATIPRGGFWARNSMYLSNEGEERARDNPVGNVGSVKRQTELAHPGKVDTAFDGRCDSIPACTRGSLGWEGDNSRGDRELSKHRGESLWHRFFERNRVRWQNKLTIKLREPELYPCRAAAYWHKRESSLV